MSMVCGRYIVGCALLLACGALGFPRAPVEMDEPFALQNIEDPEVYSYLVPAKYRPPLTWPGITYPRLDFFAHLNELQESEEEAAAEAARSKRKQPSLSIGNPMDVLRQRLLLDITRKKMKDSADKNREFLKNVGKRAPHYGYDRPIDAL